MARMTDNDTQAEPTTECPRCRPDHLRAHREEGRAEARATADAEAGAILAGYVNEIARLRELSRYIDHDTTCDLRAYPEERDYRRCTCGLDALLADKPFGRATADAEIARLREALGKYARALHYTTDIGDFEGCLMPLCQEARALLADTEAERQ